MSNFDDVRKFHQKFDMLVGDKPRQLTARKLKERLEFLWEELTELAQASGFEPVRLSDGKIEWKSFTDHKIIAEQADALIDLVYVSMGTAVMMGLPWQDLWDDVHGANMRKVRGTTKRGHAVDVTKPEGWEGPDAYVILHIHGFDYDAAEVDDNEIM